MSDASPPPNLPPRKKLTIEQPMTGASLQTAKLLIYATIAVVLAGLAFYNAVINAMAWTSPYVIAPAVGAVWFALRLFMIWSANARG